MENNNYENETICGASLVLDEKKGKWMEASSRHNNSELNVGRIDNYPNIEIAVKDSNPEKGTAIKLPDSVKNAIKANTKRRPTTRAQQAVANRNKRNITHDSKTYEDK